MVMLALSIKISCQTRYVNEMHIAQKQGRYMKKALHTAKGKEISEDFFLSSKTQLNWQNFLQISALAPKKGLNQKNKALYYTN